MNIKIYKTIILSVVLYGCEAWSLTLREERRLRVFGNRILRRIFGSKGKENREKKNVNLKQEIHVIIQSEHFCFLDFSLRI